MRSETYIEHHNLHLVFDKSDSAYGELHGNKKYILLFTTHRSGSAYLAQLLNSTPYIEDKNESLEHHQWPNSRWTHNGILDVDKMICDTVEAIDQTIPIYKIHFNSFQHLVLSATYRDFLTSGIPLFLTRTDILAQAISLVIAEQTQAWYSRMQEQKTPIYNRNHIAQSLKNCLLRNMYWQQYFAYNDLVPYHISYELLCQDPNTICHDFFAYANINIDSGHCFTQDAFYIQRTELNQIWKKRFLEEMGTDWLSLFEMN